MEILFYLLKVSAGLVVLYGVYWLFLRQHTFFAANRFYLLAALLASLAAPLVSLPEAPDAEVVAFPTVQFSAGVVSAAAPSSLVDWPFVVWCFYATGVVFMLLRLGKNLFSLLKIIVFNQWKSMGRYVLVRATNAESSSFSFFNFLVMSHQDETRCADVILRHEAVHIRQWHSLDLIVVEILHAFLWFNPVLILYKRSLQEIHEFIADDLSTAGDRLRYARELVGYSFGVPPQALVNPFFNSSQLKNRIIMLTKNRSSRWVLGRYLLAIPVLAVIVSAVAARSQPKNVEITLQKLERKTLIGFVYDEVSRDPLVGANVVIIGTTDGTTTDAQGGFKIEFEQDKELAISFVGFKTIVCTPKMYNKVKDKNPLFLFLPKETNALAEVVVEKSDGSPVEQVPTNLPVVATPKKDSSDQVFMVVEQQPIFKGGVSEMYKFLGSNIKYPAAASRANVGGTVFVQFVVDKMGETKDIKILKGIGFGCDEEAVRVVALMPAWIPAKQSGKTVAVQYNLPINFMIDKKKSKSEEVLDKSDSVNDFNENTIYIVDGVELSNKSIEKINPLTIKSMEVLKGEKAIKAYGERAKDGVIIIKTKTNNPKKD